MYQVKLLSLLLLTQISQVFAFRGVWVISNAWGNKDLNAIQNSQITKYLPYNVADFTVASPDTQASYMGFLTSNLQHDKLDLLTVPKQNIHAIFNQANIPTAHFGAWGFNNQPDATVQFLSSDPRATIANAIKFAQTNNNYFITVFMPVTDAAFHPATDIIKKIPGVSPQSNTCRDSIRSANAVTRYKGCPRQIYAASRILEDRLIGSLLQVLNSKSTITFWTSNHGPYSEHVHANAAPLSSLRGEAGSLYDGGIRTVARHNIPAILIQASSSVNAIDLLPTFIAAAKLNYNPSNYYGINLLDTKAQRTVTLQWAINKPSEGHCSNTSPANARKIKFNQQDYMLLFDRDRTEIYPWNSGYQLQQANIKITPPPRPNYSLKGCALPVSTGIKKPNLKPNPPKVIYFILADDAGFADYSKTSGHNAAQTYPSTPNLDALADAGLKLNAYYTAAAVCSPTRASIMAGRYPFNRDVAIHNAYDDSRSYDPASGNAPYLGATNNKNTYITSFFAAQPGWKAAHFGKWHLAAPGQTNIGDARYGLDSFKCHACDAPIAQQYNNKDLFFPAKASKEIIADAIAYTEQQLKNGYKVFVNIWLQNSHSPINLKYDQPAELGYPDSNNPYLINTPQVIKNNERPAQIYHASLKEQDNQIGNLRAWIKTNNLDKDTIIIYSSDNGPEYRSMYFMNAGSPGPHRGGKRTNGEGGLHSFAFINWGSYLTGSTNQLISSVDWYPTLASLAGLDIKSANDYTRLDGIDMSDCLLRNKCDTVKNRALLWETRYDPSGASCIDIFPRYAIRRGNFKLYLDSKNKQTPRFDKFTRTELYDVVNDPLESQNLAVQYPELIKNFTAILRSYDKYDDDHWPAKMGNHLGNFRSANLLVGGRC